MSATDRVHTAYEATRALYQSGVDYALGWGGDGYSQVLERGESSLEAYLEARPVDENGKPRRDAQRIVYPLSFPGASINDRPRLENELRVALAEIMDANGLSYSSAG